MELKQTTHKMKQLFYLFVAVFITTACSDSLVEKDLNNHTLEKKENQFRLSKEEAKEAISSFLAMIDSSEPTESFRSAKVKRQVEEVISLENTSFPTARSGNDNTLKKFAENFYVVNFTDNNGYAFVSNDKRTEPVFALLDSGSFDLSEMSAPENQVLLENMNAGRNYEIHLFDSLYNEYQKNEAGPQTRKSGKKAKDDTEDALNQFVRDGWKITRRTGIRTKTLWGQTITEKPSVVLTKNGAFYKEIYGTETRSSASNANVFGCTPVAFGQVLYALRNCNGVKNLKYTNGEPVLWNKMNLYSYDDTETQRFLGWITANCDPTYFDAGTMVYNRDGKKFVDDILGNYLHTYYDNCVVASGDFDGYGWSEDKRVSGDMFNNSNCLVIMTASRGTLNYISYHSYVIDGVVEFQKRIKGSGFLGTGIFRKWHDGVRHLYHINAGWSGKCNGYFLYVQSVGNQFKYTGETGMADFRSKVGYTIIKPK